MIVDTLGNSGLYLEIHPGFNAAFEWIAKTDFVTLNPGEYRITDGVRAIVDEYTTVSDTNKMYEAHRKNIDIQYIVRGKEMMLVHPLDGLESDLSYDDENDIIFFRSTDAHSRIVVAEGMFAVFFTQDVHSPGLAFNSPSQVKKVVVKVAVSTD